VRPLAATSLNVVGIVLAEAVSHELDLRDRAGDRYGFAGTVPPLAARILANDTEEQYERDNDAYTAWCAARGVECVRVLGVSEFSPV
jgi:hypothetical protein